MMLGILTWCPKLSLPKVKCVKSGSDCAICAGNEATPSSIKDRSKRLLCSRDSNNFYEPSLLEGRSVGISIQHMHIWHMYFGWTYGPLKVLFLFIKLVAPRVYFCHNLIPNRTKGVIVRVSIWFLKTIFALKVWFMGMVQFWVCFEGLMKACWHVLVENWSHQSVCFKK